ncbi:MAG: hypothetical protein HXO56_09795 [Rothia dentocariosa]|uniref:Uncharacterized protein n=1 Tax=Rothia dentocariosa TaxID=2047 RepID=A0A930PJT9_9MICC|nr:hypothetical protein [Rothia dentocariosa]
MNISANNANKIEDKFFETFCEGMDNSEPAQSPENMFDDFVYFAEEFFPFENKWEHDEQTELLMFIANILLKPRDHMEQFLDQLTIDCNVDALIDFCESFIID